MEHRRATSRRRTLAQDKQQAARDESARCTAVCAEATVTLHRIDDDWCLCTAWSDDSADVAALTDAWSAPSAAEGARGSPSGLRGGGRITGR